jgi:AGZA family xanthine/uracil permease-like MFS transporter
MVHAERVSAFGKTCEVIHIVGVVAVPERYPGGTQALRLEDVGLLLTAALYARGVKAAILIGVASATAAGLALNITPYQAQALHPEQWTSTFGRLDIPSTLRLGLFEIVFVFLFVDLFDNLGTLVAVGKRARLIGQDGSIPRLNRILTSDALATTAGAFFGTSTVVSYIESAAGVAAGGRTGVTAVVTGLLFLLALPLASLAAAIPTQATACALILVGALMVEHTAEIDWSDKAVAIPSFLTLVTIPLTFSIANGLAIGFTSYVALQVATGHARRIHPLLYLLVAVFLFRFAWLAAG